jgi:hypothetical protein
VPDAAPGNRAATVMASRATPASASAVASATQGRSTPPGSTRLPPEKRVDVVLAWSAAKSK